MIETMTKKEIISKILEKMFDQPELDTNEKVLLLRAVGRYADENYEVPTTIKEQMLGFIKEHQKEITDIFSTDIENLMGFFHEDYINWNCQETFENLATVQEFYTALLGLWMVDEYDPTDGKAWSILTDTTNFVENNMTRFSPAKKMVSHFRNPSSMNPIQDLWRAMGGSPITSV